jgi:hypothetical protein
MPAMPYPFAHPAAVLPLVPMLGRLAVPSALVIGSVVPDAWYLFPGLQRADSHGAAGLVFFCLPVGFVAYLLFHLLVRDAVVALLPRRIAAKLAFPLPDASWTAICLSLIVGAMTHVGWDIAAHSLVWRGVTILQHASTAFGTLALAWWCARWLRRAPARGAPRPAPPLWRALFVLALAACAWRIAAEGLASDAETLRRSLRAAGAEALRAFGLALLVYCAAWKLRA